MKPQSFFRYLFILPFCVFILSANGQAGNNLGLDRKSLVASAGPDHSSAGSSEAALAELKLSNPRVFRFFTRSFGNATDIKFHVINRETFIYCRIDGIKNRIAFDKKGHWKHTIRYYSEKELPKDIRQMVKSTYYDFDIFGVTEVTVGDKTAYLVNIEDGSSWKTIRVVDGEMDIMQAYSKQ